MALDLLAFRDNTITACKIEMAKDYTSYLILKLDKINTKC